MDKIIIEEIEGCIDLLEEIKSSIPHVKGGLKFPDNNLRKLFLVKGKLLGIENVLKDFRKQRE